MPKGRPRKPTEAHLLAGTYRADRHGPRPGDAEDGISPPAKPADLGGDAAALWDELAALLAGTVRAADALQLAELCRWWATVRRIRTALDKAQPGSLRCSRLMGQISTAAAAADRIASRFGLTPSDRAKLGVVQVGPAKPKVATRQPTALDRAGPPRPGK